MQIVQRRAIYFGISILLIVAGFVFMGINAASGKGLFNFDVQFIGGTSMEFTLNGDFDNSKITSIVSEVTGESAPQVQKFTNGNKKGVAIKTKTLEQAQTDEIESKIKELYEVVGQPEIENVSATVSGEMVRDSVVSVIIACICMLIYVSIRFRDFAMGVSSILALVHDALVVLCAYAVLRVPMNNSFIAAILTVLGYSINSSIVIFDRIRENRTAVGRTHFAELANLSVKQTLTRSLFTSLTTFFTVACLYVWGVNSIKEFVLPIAVGIVAGTYSSVLIAPNIWVLIATAIQKKKNAAIPEQPKIGPGKKKKKKAAVQ
ncbi:MAG: protein translocase subunit SecF [Firmicutes bacterium]|nr:protein translocase subunit SecF [Bacillota bacterium]